jgi:hypothetical protein
VHATFLDPRHLVGWWGAATGNLRTLLRFVAHHTGLPVVVVAAVALVLSWRAVRQSTRFAFEVLVALAMLVAATRLGWIRW